MGLFSSILKPFKNIFRETSKVIFGKPDKVKYTDPRKMIAPPSWQESKLLSSIYPIAQREAKRAGFLGNVAFSNFSPAMSSLKSISQGNLPDPYKRATETLFKEELGGYLDKLAKRGILNSSVAQGAISDALQRANNLQVNYLSQAAQLATLPYTFSREAEKDYLAYPTNLWNTMMSARYGLRATPILQKGSGGLVGALLPAAGSAAGFAIGGPIGGAIGGQLGGLLGRTMM